MRKLTVLLTVGIAVLGLSIAASASNPTILRANIPFAFYADKELLPAGQYTFELRPICLGSATASAVAVRNQDGSLAAFLLTMPGTDYRANSDLLYFNRYGNKYFLSKVEALGFQANLKATKIEREIRAQIKSQDTVVAGM
jgi:hypothetical protein